MMSHGFMKDMILTRTSALRALKVRALESESPPMLTVWAEVKVVTALVCMGN